MTTICYKTSKPAVYNTDTFLAYYTYKTREEAQKEVDEINTTKPEKLWNGELAKCNERIYFVDEQELFEN